MVSKETPEFPKRSDLHRNNEQLPPVGIPSDFFRQSGMPLEVNGLEAESGENRNGPALPLNKLHEDAPEKSPENDSGGVSGDVAISGQDDGESLSDSPVDCENTLNSDEAESHSPTASLLDGITRRALLILLGVTLLLALPSIGYYYFQNLGKVTLPAPVGSAPTEGNATSAVCQPYYDLQLGCDFRLVPSDDVERNMLVSVSHKAGEKVDKGTVVELRYSSGKVSPVVPNLTGKTLDEARKELYKLGLGLGEVTTVEAADQPERTVVSTTPGTGEKLKNGDTVNVMVANGDVTIPDWTGKTSEHVIAESKTLGVLIEWAQEESDSPDGIVLKQSATGKIRATEKVIITISRSKQSAKVAIPAVVGKTAEEAQLDLATVGFQKIKTVIVHTPDVTSKQVMQVVPDVGTEAETRDNVVLIVGDPNPVTQEKPQS